MKIDQCLHIKSIDEKPKYSNQIYKGENRMLKELIWKSFERTGKVDLYLLFKEFEGDSYHNIHELMAADEVAISN